MKHLDAFADALIEAHQSGNRCAPDGPAPKTNAEAYYIQARVSAALGPIAGFKAALKPGQEPIMSPIVPGFVFASGATVAIGDVMGVELEVGWKIVAPLPDQSADDFEAKLCRSVRPVPVIELVNSRLRAPLAEDPIAKLADFQINHGLIIGATMGDWDGRDIGNIKARMQAGDNIMLDGPADVPGGSAFSTLKMLLAKIGTHCGGLQVGQIVITGSLHPLTYIDVPCEVHGQIDGLGAISVRLN
ncbi:hypothetical protein [Yoonia vestfoldensis]|uniref:2-keto-4-pentenoate hydratase-like n=1 Tax=Yoonia vestfoldensis SKA53 TaxID=314232 RepID=A3V8V2_9RHOB|nr:hypothetical protein [Yoonia vestfoldensis]EAQ05315.1 2-keto-4-pentenoate hydratase-like [Yoonia vestfoldensis SKA53]